MEQNNNGKCRSLWALFFGGALLGIRIGLFLAQLYERGARERLDSRISNLDNRCKKLEENQIPIN